MSNAIEILPTGVRATVDALLDKYRGQQTNTAGPTRSRRLVDVSARMALALRDVTQQHGKSLGSNQVASINDLLRDWDEAIADARQVPTWRARIGAGEDFPMHVPSCVERAMMNQIAELYDHLVPADREGNAPDSNRKEKR